MLIEAVDGGTQAILHAGDSFFHHAQLSGTAPAAVEAFAGSREHDGPARARTQQLLADLEASATVRLMSSHDPNG